MPGGDRTGPQGLGPMTGRGAGYCGGYDRPGFASPVPGYGRRFGGRFGGWGGGRGWRHWYHATGLPAWARPEYPVPVQTTEQELTGLKNEAEWLKGQLEAINQRIQALEKE
ncbi:MAG: DUF5320 domain-containing protein [Anaerolineales bacterium]|jgi:hypothetical protein